MSDRSQLQFRWVMSELVWPRSPEDSFSADLYRTYCLLSGLAYVTCEKRDFIII